MPGHPQIPRREEAEWLVSRVTQEIERSRGVAPAPLIEEYQKGLEAYQQVLKRAR